MKTTYWIFWLSLTTLILGACAPVTQVASTVENTAQPESATVNPASETCDGSGQAHGGNGGTHEHNTDIAAQLPASAVGEISQAEADGLAFMREEEKLARDVYLTLYDSWGLRPFSNISASEQTHTDAVKTLLEMYAIPDPVTDDSIGVFVNADLQALYIDLIAKGNTSLVDAIEVGAAIEEIDILDLLNYLENTDEENLTWVYQNLLSGSYNHLRAFARQYEMQTGEAYVPQYMSQAAYDAIISASNGQGGRQGGHGGGNHSGKHN